MTQQVAFTFSGDYSQNHNRVSLTASGVWKNSVGANLIQVGDGSEAVDGVLTTSSGSTLPYDTGTYDLGNGFWIYPSTNPNTYPIVPSPQTLGGQTFTWPGTFDIFRERAVDTEFRVHKFLRYRFQADLHVSVGEEPICSCGSQEHHYGVDLKPLEISVIIDGHREDIFISEEKTMKLPVVSCSKCNANYYHLSLIREYV